MKHLILIGLGGALGAIARWKLGGLVLHQTPEWRFPLSTFLVNVVGCLLAGVIAGLATKLDLFTEGTRLFLLTGVLGGFTTFSAFGLETVNLARRGDYAIALAYMFLSAACGVAALWLAMAAIPGKTST